MNHRAAVNPAEPRRWSYSLGTLPGIGASLLPVGACPACWPAYAGVLGSLGLGFLLNATYLFPLLLALLGLALVSLAWRAPSRRGYVPFFIGFLGSSVVLVGRFALSSNALLYVGATVLFGASIWNSWPHRAAPAGSCAACSPQNQQLKNPEHMEIVS